jgi:TetR/AcrR family transcriptional repressor of nem operon
MGHSQAEKAATHARIVEIAARRFRERGLEGISVADIMSEAGMTVGGFYRHFETRDHLVVEAMLQAFADLDGWEDLARGNLRQAIQGYLSEAHRDDLPGSCAMAALANDVSRASEEVRDAFGARVSRMFGLLQSLLASGTNAEKRAKAMTIFSACVGALSLARAVPDRELSRSILRNVTSELLSLYSDEIVKETRRAS